MGNSPITNIVLFIDEAQNLNPATLNQLFDLCELAKDSPRQVQLLVVARNESDLHLNQPEMASLNHAISIRESLSPIPQAELDGYIQHRLRQAGAKVSDVFEADALQEIYADSQGRPRAVNMLCTQGMENAAAKGETVINAAHLNRGMHDSFDDTLDMRTSLISSAVERYAEQADQATSSDSNSAAPTMPEPNNHTVKSRKPLFDIPELELGANEPNQTSDQNAPFPAFQLNNEAGMSTTSMPENKAFDPAEIPEFGPKTIHFPDNDPDTGTYDKKISVPAVVEQLINAPQTTQPADPEPSSSKLGWLLGIPALLGVAYFAYLSIEQKAEIAELKSKLNQPSVDASPNNETSEAVPVTALSKDSKRSKEPAADSDEENKPQEAKIAWTEPEAASVPIAKTYPLEEKTPAEPQAEQKAASADNPVAKPDTGVELAKTDSSENLIQNIAAEQEKDELDQLIDTLQEPEELTPLADAKLAENNTSNNQPENGNAETAKTIRKSGSSCWYFGNIG